MLRLLLGIAALGLVGMSSAPTAAWAAGNPDEGKKSFAKCRACHQLEAGKNAVGPSLAGLFGRKAGSMDGYKFSDAMKNSGIVWSDETIGKYLADPKDYIKGNKMVFPGIKKESEVADLIAFLKGATN